MTALGRGESPSVFFLRNNWGLASFSSGDTRRALEQYDEALRIATQRSIGGEPPPYLLLNRATALLALARYDEALAAYNVAIDSATRGGNATVRIAGVANRAYTYLQLGDLKRAESELAQVSSEIGKSIPPDSVPAMTIIQVQARIDAENGRLGDAIAGVSKVVEFFDGRQMRVAGIARALLLRGDLYLRNGNPDAAMKDARRALEIAQSLQGEKPYSSLTGQAMLLTARIHEHRGEVETARSVAAQAVPQLSETLGPAHPDTRRAQDFSLAAQRQQAEPDPNS
jgi:tetratricopeptide (TPR) repeat protein